MSTLADFHLPRRVRRTLATLAPVVLTEDVLALQITEEVVDSVELFLRSVPAPVRAGVVAGALAFEASARVVPSSLGRPFSRLGPEQARAHFERWWSSRAAPLHQLARALKMFLSFAYYEHPAVKARLGYDPERWIGKVKAERAARFGEEIAAHEARVTAPDPLVPAKGGAR